MFICNGILFNHESPRRGGTFVSKKIIDAFAALKNGKQDRLFLGNIEAKRDWGYAPEYVEGMWRMLQHSVADDYLLATGETHTVREFVVEAAPYFGFEIIWEGEGINEKGIDAKTGKLLVEIDHRYFRPAEVELLLGDASKAQKILGWEPKVKFKELVKIMAESKLSE
jgi:GDPmannose 4,6-dehydratase